MHASTQPSLPLKNTENRALSNLLNPTPPSSSSRKPARTVGEGAENIFSDKYTFSKKAPKAPCGVWTTHIEGRYTAISVHQLAMAWWCFQAGHITKRQLRIWFAAQEMLERRRYTAKPEHSREAARTPSYGLDEIKTLVGGRGSKTADTAIRADLKKLNTLGLVSITERSIVFATSIEQLSLNGSCGSRGVNNPTDEIESFWTMFNQLPHPRRRVPVPRRVLRALAGGFTSGMTAVVLATLIRSLFWHKEGIGSRRGKNNGVGGTEGAYRIDGRTKREWIAQVFGITPRTITDARARLIELNWLIPLETHQHLLNRYGTHDQINTEWKPKASPETIPSTESSGGGEEVNTAQITKDHLGGSSTPSSNFSARSSTLINRSSSPTGNLNTRRPAPHRAGTTGASLRSAFEKERKKENPSKSQSRKKSGSREKKWVGKNPHSGLPNIRDIRSQDLADTGRLLELHHQAVKAGLAKPSEAGRLDFVALAQRARMSGKKSGGGGALFFWLLREKKTQFITLATEDQARSMIKEHLYGKQVHQRENQQWGSGSGGRRGDGHPNTPTQSTDFTKDERFVIACTRVAKKHRITDPFRMAHSEGWTRDRWDKAQASLKAKQWEQLQKTHAQNQDEE